MNSSIITLRVNEEMKIKLDKIALEENRSLNNLINTILLYLHLLAILLDISFF